MISGLDGGGWVDVVVGAWACLDSVMISDGDLACDSGACVETA